MEPLAAGDPRSVGSYQLVGRLGGGGMGEVFLGRSRGGRPVAVKVVHSKLANDDAFRRRFAREVRAARRVGGFFTAQVVDADPDGNPPWLVTAYVPGPSLYDAVRTHGPLPPTALTVLGAGLAEGLAAVHDCGLIHRDLKPGNVILADDGPRVIDFGIAHALDATSHESSGVIIGTPGFMSPEQAQGHTVGPPSDVFSLGSVLTFAATGRTPFGDGSVAAIVYRVVYADPDLDGVPDDLVDLIRACLAKRPADRPGVADILDQLAPSAGHATLWLPESITTMITERRDDSAGLAPAPEGVGKDPERSTNRTTDPFLTRSVALPSADLSPAGSPAEAASTTADHPPTEAPGSDGQAPQQVAPKSPTAAEAASEDAASGAAASEDSASGAAAVGRPALSDGTQGDGAQGGAASGEAALGDAVVESVVAGGPAGEEAVVEGAVAESPAVEDVAAEGTVPEGSASDDAVLDEDGHVVRALTAGTEQEGSGPLMAGHVRVSVARLADATDATVTRWFRRVGEEVAEGEPLLEVFIERHASHHSIRSPASGVLVAITAAAGKTVALGDGLAVMDTWADGWTDTAPPPVSAGVAQVSRGEAIFWLLFCVALVAITVGISITSHHLP